MKTIRLLGACLTAILALSAIAAASASAEILFEEPAGGFPQTFAVDNAGAAIHLETASGVVASCTSWSTNEKTGRGSIETAHLGKVKLALLGCKGTVLNMNVPCQSTGAKEGEIVVASTFHIGLALPEKKAAVVLLPENWTFTCLGVKVVVTGDVIGLLENGGGEHVVVGEKREELYLKFFQKKGVQEQLEFELSLGGGLMKELDLKVSIGGGAETLAGVEAILHMKEFLVVKEVAFDE
jgi:hypothetical protein